MGPDIGLEIENKPYDTSPLPINDMHAIPLKVTTLVGQYGERKWKRKANIKHQSSSHKRRALW